VAPGAAVGVRGGSVRAKTAAVDAEPQGRAVLDGVRTAGALRGVVQVTASRRGGDLAAPPVPWWDRPVRGAGAVGLVVVVAGVFLEVLRGRRRGDRDGTGTRRGRGSADAGPGDLAEPVGGDLALDLGERRVH
jgi:hypothetical protein